ncbi:hypothetical protein FSP39_024481 [Pinctada imbricata]|uniref:Interleukin-1 receptor-associated kinase 1-binding protein 1 n=1 Tax=Pinctada imbricata TaxID=66713 RepID=A0AA89BYB4_PINIB|nr:hypothetical protein FSP39_024481 [Pinctada imbricata]
MSGFKPSQAYASILGSPQKNNNQKNILSVDEENQLTDASVSSRVITVSAVGEVTLPPDRCKLTVRVSSEKESVQDVKDSVSRRVDYIIQTLHNHNLKDADIQIYKSMRRVESMYHMDTEIQVMFADLHKCQSVSNLLVEKLDETVTVNLPEFSHSSVTLQNLRQQASLLAIHNAKQKAQEMAKFVHQAVGRPISVQEQDSQEWQGPTEIMEDPEKVPSLQQKLSLSTVTVRSKVAVTFELKPKVKKTSLMKDT